MKLKLTASQMSLWVGQKMNPAIPLYNTAYAYTISGNLNERIFEKAFQSLIDTTDALRIRFGEENGVPFQYAQKSLDHELEIIDFTSKPAGETVSKWLFERAHQPLNLSRQVFDAALLRISKDKYIWYLNMHHLVTDGVSRKIVFDKMSELYASVLLNRQSGKIKSVPSYLEYVASELEEVKSHQEETDYWSDKIRDLVKKPLFYGISPEGNTTEATRISVDLGLERSKRLKTLIEHPEIKGWTTHLTRFNILSTLLFVYMYRISGQKKIALGAPLHNRIKRKYNNTVGYFLEIFPLVAEIHENDTFLSVLKRVKLENNENLKHALKDTVTQDISSSFNAVINYIHTGFGDFNGFETTSEWIYTGHIDRTHQLRCHIMDSDVKDEIKIVFDLNRGTFDDNLTQHIPHHFLNLFDAMLADVNLPIEKSALISSEEKRVLTSSVLPTPVSHESVLQIFEKWAVQQPNVIAIQSQEVILTYTELNRKANRLAHYLRKKGIDHTKKVALHFYRSSDYLISVLAVLKTGAAFIPIASDQPKKRIDFILSDSQCSLLLTKTELIKDEKFTIDHTVDVSKNQVDISKESSSNLEIVPKPENLCYVLYTSGSTGSPKGVRILNKSLQNYLLWAQEAYAISDKSIFALFTSIGFDLTITSTLLPFISGGRIVIYKEAKSGPDTALLKVLEDNAVNTIKLTPSHLALFTGKDFKNSYLNTIIVGGEDFKLSLAKSIKSSFTPDLKIFNEYGPTEATIGCIVCEYRAAEHVQKSVPIGRPISNMQAYLLDSYKNLVPRGVTGELYLSGIGLADGYVGLPDITDEKFLENPFDPRYKMYRTGDLARLNPNGDFEYQGRTDDQVKLRGYRIELSEIEANLVDYPSVENCAVVLVENKTTVTEDEVINCTKCGLPSNYPDTDFDAHGVCHLCTTFESYKNKAERYFKNDKQLVSLLTSKRGQNPNYDCISLLSGGKDSTYVLARLINMGLKVLAFTMDNGYISNQAKANIDRIVKRLNVDHIYGETPHMNEIFVDSLHRHHNVCNGCFKTIYTLSTKMALEKQIPFIVTGLSRGQFFETRLTEELFWDDSLDTQKIDDTILEARKIYHQESDAVKKLLDTSMFDDDEVFEKVEFVDFYRFSDVSLEEMLVYLKEKADWVRPTDTGRSTNCLINQVGIYVHKKDLGYSNYSFPYSWDVRLGHKTRDESLEEINEVIDEVEVKRIMQEIGYDESKDDQISNDKLVAYYTGDPNISISDMKEYVSKKLPAYMVPTIFKHLDEIPLTKNGKVDKKALENLNNVQLAMNTTYVAPRNEIEELLEKIWKEVLQLKKVGVYDDFIALGGHSLAAIRVTARINEQIELNFPLNKIFELPTIAAYSNFIEETLTTLLNE